MTRIGARTGKPCPHVVTPSWANQTENCYGTIGFLLGDLVWSQSTNQAKNVAARKGPAMNRV